MTTLPTARAQRKLAARAALRSELFERLAKGDLDLVSAVKMMRKIADRTQLEYAKMVGVSPRVLIEFERGIGNPTVRTLQKILAPFGLELSARAKPR